MFTPDYFSARKEFLKLAENFRQFQGYSLHAVPVPSATHSELFVDILSFSGSAPRKLLIVSSGIHGPETHVGSAIQRTILSRLRGEDITQLRVIFIHALNPWGYLENRRGTESNVNLNRNFSLTGQSYQHKNPGYLECRDIVEPQTQVKSVWRSRLHLWKKVFSLVLPRIKTAQQLNQGISEGQFESPQGLEYGGRGPEPQVQFVQNYLLKNIPGHSAVVHLDIHTGLGKRGVLHLITKDPNPQSKALMEAVVQENEDRDLYHITNQSEPGFYETIGDFPAFIESLLERESIPGFGMTIEFGTLGESPLAKLESLFRLVIENQGHFKGYASAAQEKEVKRLHLDLFFPDDENWRQKVLNAGTETVQTFLKRLEIYRD